MRPFGDPRGFLCVLTIVIESTANSKDGEKSQWTIKRGSNRAWWLLYERSPLLPLSSSVTASAAASRARILVGVRTA